jgi:hypothetical protein
MYFGKNEQANIGEGAALSFDRSGAVPPCLFNRWCELLLEVSWVMAPFEDRVFSSDIRCKNSTDTSLDRKMQRPLTPEELPHPAWVPCFSPAATLATPIDEMMEDRPLESSRYLNFATLRSLSTSVAARGAPASVPATDNSEWLCQRHDVHDEKKSWRHNFLPFAKRRSSAS